MTPAERDLWLTKIILGRLGEAWTWWSPRNKVAAKATRKDGKRRCANCLKYFDKSDTQVDHIVASGPIPKTLDALFNTGYLERRFCWEAGLQVLCKPCHKVKTKVDIRAMRPMKTVKKRKKLK